MKKLLNLFLLLSLLFTACSEDNPTGPDLKTSVSKGLLIVNEGVYAQNNATLTSYNYEEEKVINNVFSSANSGKNLGDTANDLFLFDGKAFIAVDKSRKIEVVDAKTFKSLAMIDLSGLGSPRELYIKDKNLAYATVLVDKVIAFNPTTYEILDTITVGSYPEGLAAEGNYLFVANSGFGSDSIISVIDMRDNKIVKNITVYQNPRYVFSHENYIYTTSAGLYTPPGTGYVYKIDPEKLAKIDSVEVSNNPFKGTIAKDILYLVNGTGVVTIDLNTFAKTNDKFIDGKSVNPIYGMVQGISFDEDKELILCGNPKDYVQNGEVVAYDLSGKEVFRFECGLNPGTIQVINE